MSKEFISSRRYFLKHLGVVTSTLALPIPLTSSIKTNKIITKESSPLVFGIVADVHADLIPDKMERLEKFINEAISKDVDFIVQLGDFCFPKKENLDFLNLWNKFKKPKYHLLGNHDMDVSSKQETMDFWGMNQKYYSFDAKDIHFVVLDPNHLYYDNQYTEYDNANFYVNANWRTYVPPEQIEWLVNDLRSTKLHTVILSHQSLINPMGGIKNRIEIQELLEKENLRAGFQKVMACLNGHDHIDFQRTLNDIHYLEINSMSYQWLGEKYSNKTRYPAELYEKYQHLDKIGTYKDSLFAFMEIDLKHSQINVEGVQSEWISPSPDELNVPKQVYGMQNSAEISNRVLNLE
ncbi:metallophosphoesterase family protein [Arcticibacterium luteifluviistationis]|uniref:Metallophosphoesterase n=1 Tax=Arcticibacterium luteifluviistationis TaxID=1784714 RepID=A0A2Z4G7E6_9BACT|nr:metallophosphoesterase [Arcticibacterium luteifluviistationis]AWV97101.1 metallophosphoesterase [Arcticibacterium luteifluviistationis]